MSITSRLPVVLLMFVVMFTPMRSEEIMFDQPRDQGKIWADRELRRAFAVIGNVVVLPLGVEEIEGVGFGISFYVGWGGVNPRIYSQVSEIVAQFRGRMKWLSRPEFNDRGAFISALPLEQAKKSVGGDDIERVSLTDLHNEVEGFCQYVGESLQIAEPTPNYNEELRASGEPFEDSAYRVLLVAKPEDFSGSPTSSSDRMLHSGITEEEWLLLSRGAEENVRSLSPGAASFLSKLKQRYEVVRLSRHDVVSLSDELVDLESGTNDRRLQGAIGKLRRILVEASDNNLGLVFEPND